MIANGEKRHDAKLAPAEQQALRTLIAYESRVTLGEPPPGESAVDFSVVDDCTRARQPEARPVTHPG